MTESYGEDIEEPPSATSFKNLLLFLLSYISKSDGRDALEEELTKLYAWAVQMSNPSPVVTFTGESDSDPTNNITNETTPPDVGKFSTELRQYLQEYANAQDRCVPFTKLANKILEAWDIFQPGLESATGGLGFQRPSDDKSLIFQRNNTECISSTHKTFDDCLESEDTEEPPDLLALRLSSAVKICTEHENTPPTSADWSKHALEHAPSIPSRALPDFREVLMSWEFLMFPKHNMPKPPHCYEPRKLSECTMAPPLSLLSYSPDGSLSLYTNEAGSAQTSDTSVVGSKRKAEGGANQPNKVLRVNDREDTSSKVTGTCGTRPTTTINVCSSRQKEMLQTRRKALAEEIPTYPESPSVEADRTVPLPLQSDIYAAKRLSSSITFTHALTATVIDEHIWLKWYERSGCIQTYGLDFITDLPWLMVLLVILKYFDDTAWGECCEVFSPLQDNKANFTLGGTRFSTEDWRPSHLSLFGRGTNIVAVTSKDVNPLDPNSHLDNAEMIAKIYWAEDTWQAEDEILNFAYAVSEQSVHVRGHLPRMIASGSFRTKDDPIVKRKELLELGEGSNLIQRRLRILIFFKLRHIRELTNDEFMIAWVDCFRCHYALWMAGLHHRDISANNLMYDRDEKGRVIGVLNDFDLSIVSSLAEEFGTERTGTVPFMAIDLMERSDKPLVHLYEYDVESFIYVLLWITRRYGIKDGNVRVVDTEALTGWLKDNLGARIYAHRQALRHAGGHAEKLKLGNYASLAEAHAKHEETIAGLCSTLYRHILQKWMEEESRTPVVKTDRTDEAYIQQLHKDFMDIINEDQLLRESEGRPLDLPDTEWATLAARGLASKLWQMYLRSKDQKAVVGDGSGNDRAPSPRP